MTTHAAHLSSGVLGTEGRYRQDLLPARPLILDGEQVVSVGPLRIYTCGITPYDVTHLGHAATFAWADLLRRVAQASGAEPVVARNITDVDDVLTAAAAERGRPYDELALTSEFLFDRDMKSLAVAAPTYTPRARGHVLAVMRLAAALLAAGAAYEADGHVYFRGDGVYADSGLPEAEALRRSTEYGDQIQQPGRLSTWDVPVWRPSGPEHPAWPSPWGWGRPGWHAECAAMALSSLGRVDVLWGGADLVFPHHAYQVAMAQVAAPGALARIVAHAGEVRLDGEKMAKSTRNLVLVGDLLVDHEPAAVRLMLLDRPWARGWDFTPAVVEQARNRLASLRAVAGDTEAQAQPRLVDMLLHELDVPSTVTAVLDSGDAAAASYFLDLLSLR